MENLVAVPGESQLRLIESSNFDMDYGMLNMHTDVNASDCPQGCLDTIKRVCTES